MPTRFTALCSAALVTAAFGLAGCNATDALGPNASLQMKETFHEGYVFDQAALDSVPVGSSREQVLLALGTPTTIATFDNEVFYYISQTRVRSAAFQRPRLVDQNVLAVYFGAESRVENISYYGLRDGKVFDFIRKVTPTGGKDMTFIQQILSGAGKRSSAGKVGF